MPLLTPKQAASELAISDKQLRVLTLAGEIRYINIGQGDKRETRRYMAEDLSDFIERRGNMKSPSTSLGGRNRPPVFFIDASAYQARRDERRLRKAEKEKKSKARG
jgi:hypothetical protein